MAVIDNFAPTVKGDDVWVSATVDGLPTTVHVWKSHLTQLAAQTAGGAAAKQLAVKTYIAGELKAQATRDAAAAPAGAAIDLSGGPLTV